MSVNGNLINSEYLREFLDTEARRHVNSDSDSELELEDELAYSTRRAVVSE